MTVLEWLSKQSTPVTRRRAEFDSGVVIFCGIGLLLSLAAMLIRVARSARRRWLLNHLEGRTAVGLCRTVLRRYP